MCQAIREIAANTTQNNESMVLVELTIRTLSSKTASTLSDRTLSTKRG